MRITVQRVMNAKVIVEDSIAGQIGNGLLVFAGFENSDTPEDIEWVCNKIVNLRIFNDSNDIMNLSLKEAEGELLLVSQFTLHASTKKGNRPSYIRAAKAETAIPLYDLTKKKLRELLGKEIQTGVFGADMKVHLLNDGPVTINIDSKNKE